MRILEDIKYNEFDECKLDIYLPEIDDFKTIVYFHGGGLHEGDKSQDNYKDMANTFIKNGYAFASCNYRMYPKYHFPDYLYDCADAIKYVVQAVKKEGGSGIIVSGQSAGAWMSLMLMLDKTYLNSVSIDPMHIDGWIIDSAQCTSHFNVIQREEGLDFLAQRIDKYAPLYFVNKETAFTKCLLLFYENDMPCRVSQNLLFKDCLLAYNDKHDIEAIKLPGGHCNGSCNKDDDGEYRYVKEAISWLKRKEL